MNNNNNGSHRSGLNHSIENWRFSKCSKRCTVTFHANWLRVLELVSFLTLTVVMNLQFDETHNSRKNELTLHYCSDITPLVESLFALNKEIEKTKRIT